MKKVVTLFLLLVTFIIYSETLKVQTDKKKAFTGEEIELKFPVVPGKEMSAFFNSETSKAAIIEVVPDELNEKTIVKLVVLESGLLEVPEMTLTVDNRKNVVESFSIEVNNRTEESDVNIRDIKGTVKFFEKDYFLLWVLISIIVPAVLIYLIRKLMKKRKKEEVSLPVKVYPVEIAEKYIREAVRKREEGDIESFVDLVTIGIRDYMSLKQGVNYKAVSYTHLTLPTKRIV